MSTLVERRLGPSHDVTGGCVSPWQQRHGQAVRLQFSFTVLQALLLTRHCWPWYESTRTEFVCFLFLKSLLLPFSFSSDFSVFLRFFCIVLHFYHLRPHCPHADLISHSMSKFQLEFVFENAVHQLFPNIAQVSLLDIGSRLGAVLFAVRPDHSPPLLWGHILCRGRVCPQFRSLSELKCRPNTTTCARTLLQPLICNRASRSLFPFLFLSSLIFLFFSLSPLFSILFLISRFSI